MGLIGARVGVTDVEILTWYRYMIQMYTHSTDKHIADAQTHSTDHTDTANMHRYSRHT